MSSAIYDALNGIRELAEAILREAPDFNEKWQAQTIKPKAQEILRHCDAISRAMFLQGVQSVRGANAEVRQAFKADHLLLQCRVVAEQ